MNTINGRTYKEDPTILAWVSWRGVGGVLGVFRLGRAGCRGGVLHALCRARQASIGALLQLLRRAWAWVWWLQQGFGEVKAPMVPG